MEHCELIPGKGIRHAGTDIFFDTQRSVLRDVLGYKASGDSMWEDEDDYSRDGEEWLRLRFLDGKLRDIEVLGGTLAYDGMELKNTDIRTLRDVLHNVGLVVEDETEWLKDGRDCIDLQIVVATGDDVGEPGGDRIEWVITSADFKVEDA
jgi:hypothetical protein